MATEHEKKKERASWKKDIITQLGGNALTLELKDEDYAYACEVAIRWEEEFQTNTTHPKPKRAKVREYAIAMATMILGRIRSKYYSYPVVTDTVAMDGPALLSDARMRFQALGCGPYGG